MDRKNNLYNGYFPVILSLIGILLVFVSIPILGIEIIMCTDIAVAVGICIWKLKTKDYSFKFPALINYFCYLTVGIAITITRTFLTVESYEEQIYLVRFVGEIICRENVVYGFASTIIIGILISSFCLWYAKNYLYEAKSRLMKLENNLHGRCISQQKRLEKEERKLMDVYRFLDYYILADSSVNLIVNIFKVFIGIFCIDVAGGVCLETFIRGMFWKEALEKYMILSSGYFLFLCIPLIIISFSFKINEKKYYTSIL